MTDSLPPAKVVLLAVQFAEDADIDSLAALAAQRGSVLGKELLLRILLTCLPESVPPAEYVSFLREIDSAEYTSYENHTPDLHPVAGLDDAEATARVRKLRLLPLAPPNTTVDSARDPLTQFLVHRAYKIDEDEGLLEHLPALINPFLDRSPHLRIWMVSVVLPWIRRTSEYYVRQRAIQNLASFEQLPDRVAVDLLLSETGAREEDLRLVGRDLRGLVGPWLQSDTRWRRNREPSPEAQLEDEQAAPNPGWDEVLQWLVRQASTSWRVAVAAVEQWHGPSDVDLGSYGPAPSDEEGHQYMVESYARAALGVAHLIPDASTEALTGAYAAVSKVRVLLGAKASPPLHTAASHLPPIPGLEDIMRTASSRNLTWLRSTPLDSENGLTSPSRITTDLFSGLALSAFLLTRAGAPCSMRRAGELLFLRDEREQKTEAIKMIHAISNNGPKSDDHFWERVRNEILWLRDWGVGEGKESAIYGVFSHVKREILDVEILKALLSNSRYALARALYEEPAEPPLPRRLLQDTIFAAALSAYDNASSPSRARGGVKKCDEIIHAFPTTIERSMVATQRIEALLKATHTLSNYRLVLKQGEPFTPVMLRVHSDPIAIVSKVLEQNSRSYTQIQDMLDLGSSIVGAGLTVKDRNGHSTLTPEQEPEQQSIAERRITAMCIDAALTEDDFETAYSYVVNRLAAFSPPTKRTAPSPSKPARVSIPDDWSWKAALQAGKYRRTSSLSSSRTSQRATHAGGGLGTSANPDIRHLEHRIECLSTALRIAPTPTLQEILNAFRRCEEELDAKVRAETAREEEWDAQGDNVAMSREAMPGGFSPEVSRINMASNNVRPGRGSGRPSGGAGNKSAEDAPMSLFDLSRASARAAQKNLTALSNLQQSIMARAPGSGSAESAPVDAQGQQRARKRDQLRDAAMGAMVSGVGWLVGAHPTERRDDDD